MIANNIAQKGSTSTEIISRKSNPLKNNCTSLRLNTSKSSDRKQKQLLSQIEGNKENANPNQTNFS